MQIIISEELGPDNLAHLDQIVASTMGVAMLRAIANTYENATSRNGHGGGGKNGRSKLKIPKYVELLLLAPAWQIGSINVRFGCKIACLLVSVSAAVEADNSDKVNLRPR